MHKSDSHGQIKDNKKDDAPYDVKLNQHHTVESLYYREGCDAFNIIQD